MENRFFTRKTGIYAIVCPAVPILVGLLLLIQEYPQIIWLFAGYSCYVIVITIVSLNFPVISDDALIIANSVFRFIRTRYRYTDIEEVKIIFGGYQNLGCKIKLKGKKYWYRRSISSMGYSSIPIFVEVLRSNGVYVICPPYRYNGHMIYL